MDDFIESERCVALCYDFCLLTSDDQIVPSSISRFHRERNAQIEQRVQPSTVPAFSYLCRFTVQSNCRYGNDISYTFAFPPFLIPS